MTSLGRLGRRLVREIRSAGTALRLRKLDRLAPLLEGLPQDRAIWPSDYFERLGYFRSVRERAAVDADGDPVPWYTYPAIEYLRGLDLSGLEVFEYGAGNSSAFWATRAKRVHSVEHDPAWRREVERRRLPNLTVTLEENPDDYVGLPASLGRPFDVIVIDAERRLECAKTAPGLLRDDGLIVLDNSDWWPKTAAALRDAGLTQIDFTGPGPLNPYAWTTSLFLGRDFRPWVRADGRLPRAGVAALRQTVDEENES